MMTYIHANPLNKLKSIVASGHRSARRQSAITIYAQKEKFKYKALFFMKSVQKTCFLDFYNKTNAKPIKTYKKHKTENLFLNHAKKMPDDGAGFIDKQRNTKVL